MSTPARHDKTGNELGNRIATGLQAYSQSSKHEVPSLRATQQAAYLARDYVDWHAKVALLAGVDEASEFVRRLKSLLRDIHTFRDNLANEDGGTVLTRDLELGLQEQATTINGHEQNVREEWSRIVSNALEEIHDRRNQCLIEATLSSRLPDARLRRKTETVADGTTPVD